MRRSHLVKKTCLAVLALCMQARAEAANLRVAQQVAAQQPSSPQQTVPSSSVPPPADTRRPLTSPSIPTQQQAPQQTPVVPVGTAAAPEMKTEGVPASAPAGAAIAPAKQKRVKSFSVRVALLVGAVVAVGVVAGAALATSSSAH